MQAHHQRAIEHATGRFRGDPEVQALLLGGSIAHGLESPTSDVDLLIAVADRDYQARLREGRLQFLSAEGCDWPGGFVEGKYIGLGFLEEVARAGSEPARFAFEDARVLFSRVGDLGPILREIARYPVAEKADRIRRFHAQFEAWHWYAHEGLKRGDRYLLGIGVARTVLFGGRMILAHNEILYPYHKWFLEVLRRAPERPADLLARIEAVYDEPSQASLLGLWATVKNFRSWEAYEYPWTTQFLLDSELGWQSGSTPVDDL